MKRLFALAILATCSAAVAEPPSFSGIYPSLATFNHEGECGTGAVVPWADRLWVISYGPHMPFGSSDKLYEITPDLRQIIRPESIGGTPADRLIHRESNQLFLGPYVIDATGNVRVIPWQQMPGRLTGAARHLTDPAHKVYLATMEAGLYEVDVQSLEVTGLFKDRMNIPKPGSTSEAHPASMTTSLPGWHSKGLYSGQGRLVLSNNGEHGPLAESDPDTESGALGEWSGAGDFQLVRRAQFTEVTGPGGIYGNEHPDTDPLWSMGWDKRSLLLECLDHGAWRAWRLPKTSHTYDGAHGWHTEWPRIRDIGENDLLMTMHGGLWRFPRTFSSANSAGLAPRSSHLCVTGDFCAWNGRIVFGCDISAKSAFLGARKAKGAIASAGQSQSNLWFTSPASLDELGPALGRGAVWWNDPAPAGVPSDPYLFSGYSHRGLWLQHGESQPVTFRLEVDPAGHDAWQTLREVTVPANSSAFVEFRPGETGAWIRLRPDRACAKATAFFHYRNDDPRPTHASDLFAGVARPEDRDVSGGLLYARGADLHTLAVAGRDAYYELDSDLKLTKKDDPVAAAFVRKAVAIPAGVITIDAASALYEDEHGRRWRLPKGDPDLDTTASRRVDREVVTERDLFNCAGTFYELPADSAGGFTKIRPIATHNRCIEDYATYRGLLLLSGISANAQGDHILRSEDGAMALWAGALDDLWQLGKPRGTGGPWKETPVKAGEPSDPYLATGYDHKRVLLSHNASLPIKFRIEADVSGEGSWLEAATLTVPPHETLEYRFPEALGAYWFRIIADADATASAVFVYE